MHFAKVGDVNDGHTHIFDHQTLLGKGSVKVTVNGKVSEFTAPTIIFIRAGFEHQIEALEDDTICYCIHAIRDGERVEDIIDPADIPEGGMDYRFIEEAVDTIVPTPKQYTE
jgi:quercetin dioxygenase-like cupin family protein